MRFPDEFFPVAVDMLRGTISADEMTRRLGPSASGIERLEYYRTLMRRNVELILGSLFPAFKHLLSSDSGRFQTLVQQYDRRHPPDHFEPNTFGRLFPEFIERLSSSEVLPAGATELVDYEWVRYAVGIVARIEEPLEVVSPSPRAEEQPRSVPQPPVRAIVRHYDYDVPTYASSVWRGELPERLTHRPTAVLIYRRSDGHSAVLRPTIFDLMALAAASGRPEAGNVELVASEEVVASRARLMALGILGQS